MKFKVNFKAPVFNLEGYKQHLHAYMEDWLKQAGKEWLQATVIAIIPVWSNASRATFKKLAGELDFPLPYGPQKSITDRIPLGLSTGAGSGVEIDQANFKYHFVYSSTLRYLAYNEYNRVVYGIAPNVFSRRGLINPTPYHFQEKGQLAFEQFSKYTELPNPFEFLKVVKV